MFCRKCGNQLEENAKFCAKCGTATEVSTEATEAIESTPVQRVVEEKKVDKNVIKYTLKPTYQVGYKLCTNIIWTVLFVVFIIFYMTEDFMLTWEILSKYAGFMFLGGTIYILIKMAFEKKQYDNLQYNFYHNKLEYVDGFINKEQKELKYKHIREVTMSQNILERIFNIGTIKVHTSASSGMASSSNHGGMNGRNGITVHCITDIRTKYQTIKEIIDEGTEE